MASNEAQETSLFGDWKVMPLGAVLERSGSPVTVVPNVTYQEIGIRSHGKGLFHKEPVTGASLGNKRVFQVVPGSLVLNIVFAWEGAVAVISERERGMIASHRFPMLVPRDAGVIVVEFLRRFFQTEHGVRLLGDASPGGAGRNRTLNQKFLAEIPIPIPPVGVQKKIVAILGAVDDAIEATKAVIEQLSVVRAAIMVELLTRGFGRRHTRFQESEIGPLPQEWELVSLGDLIAAGPDNGMYKPQTEYGDGVPIVRIDAFDNGDVIGDANLRRMRASEDEVARFGLHPGDILVNRVNSLSHIAKTALVGDLTEPTVFESNMMRFTVDANRILPAFAFRVVASPAAKAYFVGRAKQAVAQASVNQQDVRALPIPLPQLDEQVEIVRVAKGLDERVSAEVRAFDALRHTKAALVSVLLDRGIAPDASAA